MSPPRQYLGLLVLIPLLSAFTATAACAQTRDVAGARDFPGIGRFGGSVITGYVVKDFDATQMQAAALQGRPAGSTHGGWRGASRGSRIAPQSRSLDPRSPPANFETQLAKAGFKTLLACDTDACGAIPFTEAIDVLPVPQMWVDGFNYHYYAGRREDGGRETFASVVVSQNNQDITAQLTVAELGAIENKMVDAAAMAKGLGETGHIALYGRSTSIPTRPSPSPGEPPGPWIRSQSCSPDSRSSMSISSATPTTRAPTTTTSICRGAAPRLSPPSSSKATASRSRGCAPPASASWRLLDPTRARAAAR